MQSSTQICLRFKRQKQTYFFACTPYESIDSIKKKLAAFFKGVQSNDIRLYLGPKLLDEKSNVHDQGLVNNTLIYFKFRKGNTGQWEDIPDLGFGLNSLFKVNKQSKTELKEQKKK